MYSYYINRRKFILEKFLGSQKCSLPRKSLFVFKEYDIYTTHRGISLTCKKTNTCVIYSKYKEGNII